tara:strand:+ start:288 stop:914 length:627 start_codon:yes stop_codon:yes gene_type:complete
MDNKIYYRIYYTKKCNECLKLMNVIINEGITPMFILICLDSLSSKEIGIIAKQINLFPTIIISHENRNEVYDGPVKCSQWLNTFIKNRRMSIINNVNQRRKMIAKKQLELKLKNDGINEYNEDEMEGIADEYAYNTNMDIYQSKNFIPVGKEEYYNIITPQNQLNKMDVKNVRDKLSELEKTRNNDFNEINKFLEKEQINTVMNKIDI